MPDDASNDWLEVAKTRAQGIRTALAGIGFLLRAFSSRFSANFGSLRRTGGQK
jgi:hypothetical protein